MKINDNHARAQKVVENWPSWKQGYSLTKHSHHEKPAPGPAQCTSSASASSKSAVSA